MSRKAYLSGYSPSWEWFFTARLNPCPSCRDAFPSACLVETVPRGMAEGFPGLRHGAFSAVPSGLNLKSIFTRTPDLSPTAPTLRKCNVTVTAPSETVCDTWGAMKESAASLPSHTRQPAAQSASVCYSLRPWPSAKVTPVGIVKPRNK
jgi:hypothetical protein